MIFNCEALGVRQLVAAFNDGIYSVLEKITPRNKFRGTRR